MTTWVIGGGGLFGSALVRHRSGIFTGQPIPWDDPYAALETLRMSLADFSAIAGEPWCIAWTAGRATTSSSAAETERELTLFRDFVEHLSRNPPHGPGVFLLASSAGGLYAGSKRPPFDRTSPVDPISHYGRLKQSQEQAAIRLLSPMMSVVIARLSNLYGPGQDLGKLQGLISRLALAAITKESLSIYVPLDTLRDYIEVDDAAARAAHWIERAAERQAGAQIRVIASGESVSVGRIIALMQSIARVRIPIAYGLMNDPFGQAQDLRLVPDTDHVIDNLPLTPMPVGMKEVHLDLLRRHAAARIAT